MYLAGILALCALLHVSAWEGVGSSAPRFALRSEAGIPRQISGQEPAPPDRASQQTAASEQAKPDTSRPPNSETKPQDKTEVQPTPPVTPGTVPNEPTQPTKQKKSGSKKRPSKNHHNTPATQQEPPKKVVRRGSTAEPNAQLTPSITEEQAARQREDTNNLLASTDASLQKLSGRQLTQDEQETVGQIRKFMEQVKEADKEGDLQRAYKLALKAHLLSDALAKP
jgi:outer membrane biosynthesis protein TonB